MRRTPDRLRGWRPALRLVCVGGGGTTPLPSCSVELMTFGRHGAMQGTLGGKDGQVWALPARPMYSFHLVSGRLLTTADARSGARVVVVERWLIGIPLGFELARAVVALAQNVFNTHVLFVFPALNIPLALIGTLVLALVAMQVPLRRAVHYRPGEALRYA